MAMVAKLKLLSPAILFLAVSAADVGCTVGEELSQCNADGMGAELLQEPDEASVLQVSAAVLRRSDGSAEEEDASGSVEAAFEAARIHAEHHKAQPRPEPQAEPEMEPASITMQAVQTGPRAEPVPEAPVSLMQTVMARRAEGERAAAAAAAAHCELEASIAAIRRQQSQDLAAGVPHPMSLSQVGASRQGTQITGLFTLSNLILVGAILLIVFFGLVLYHNNFNAQAAINEIKNDPSAAFQDARSEAGNLYAAGKASSTGQQASSWFSGAGTAANTAANTAAQGASSSFAAVPDFDPFSTQAQGRQQKKTCC